MNTQTQDSDITLTLGKQHTLFALSNISETDKIKHVIASTYFVRDNIAIDSYYIRHCLKTLNIDSLIILYISDKPKHSEYKVYNYNEPRVLSIHVLGTKELQNMISGDLFNEINQTCLYILDDIKWYHMVKLFIASKKGLTVSGGSTAKRHVVSRLENRFISYLLAIFDLDSNKLNTFNDFDAVNKTRYLPYYDFSNKTQVRGTDSKGNIQVINLKDSLNDDKDNDEIIKG